MQPRGPLRTPFSIINTALHCSGKYSPVVSCTHHIVLWQPGLRAHKTPQLHTTAFVGKGKILINMYSVEKEYNALGTINTSQSKSSPPGSCYPDCQSQCSPTPCYNWYTLVPCGDRHFVLWHTVLTEEKPTLVLSRQECSFGIQTNMQYLSFFNLCKYRTMVELWLQTTKPNEAL